MRALIGTSLNYKFLGCTLHAALHSLLTTHVHVSTRKLRAREDGPGAWEGTPSAAMRERLWQSRQPRVLEAPTVLQPTALKFCLSASCLLCELPSVWPVENLDDPLEGKEALQATERTSIAMVCVEKHQLHV